uniref:Uncharacterized protein n=1 Tax=Catagonus wagneri TaxID=51154 RepID=A0A8C3YCU2_9CETA
MKIFVKMFLWLLRKKQLRLHSLIIITITGISILGPVIFQSTRNQKHQTLLSSPLLQGFITVVTIIGTRVTKDRVTQRTEICQQEVKVYNFLFHKNSSDERDA